MDHSEIKHLPKVDHTPAELEEWAQTLLRAADLIDVRGLCKNGSFSDKRGRLCVLGAIDAVRGYEPGDGMFMDDPVMDKAADELSAAIGESHIPGWNDAPGRTKDEVVAKLRAVALGL